MSLLPVSAQPPLLPTLSSSRARVVCFELTRLKLNNRILGHQLHGARQARRLANQPKRFRRLICSAAGLSELAPTAAAVYGGLLLGGGLLAYTRSSSKGSLFGGLTGGTLLGLAFLLMRSLDTKDIGDAIGFGSALLFVAIFGIRLAATRNFFPAAPLLLLSIVASAIFMLAYLQDRV